MVSCHGENAYEHADHCVHERLVEHDHMASSAGGERVHG